MSQSQLQKIQIDFHGRPLTVETGRLARQAGGAVLVQFGETVVLVTATASGSPREGIDFFPLTCDYQEKTFAAGKIPGGFFKREGRPAEKEILISRLIDRPIRPLFPKGRHNKPRCQGVTTGVRCRRKELTNRRKQLFCNVLAA